MPLFGKLFRLRAGQTMDLCAPCVAGIVGGMRIACRLVGCCGGREIHYMGRTFFPPTQLIDMGWDFYLMGLLLYFNLKKEKEGIAYPMFMLGYGAMRFILEFFRDTEKDWLHLSHGQVFSLIAIVIAVYYIKRSGYRFGEPMHSKKEADT